MKLVYTTTIFIMVFFAMGITASGQCPEKNVITKMTSDMARLIGIPTRPLTEARIELVRHSSVEPDYDNLVGSFKAIIDGLRDAGVSRLARLGAGRGDG